MEARRSGSFASLMSLIAIPFLPILKKTSIDGWHHLLIIRRDETTIVEADITLAVIDRDGRLQCVPTDFGTMSDMRETN